MRIGLLLEWVPGQGGHGHTSLSRSIDFMQRTFLVAHLAQWTPFAMLNDGIFTVSLSCVLLMAAMGCGGRGMPPQTTASKLSGYTYVPVDPQAIKTTRGTSCTDKPENSYTVLLDALPDNTVRMSAEQFDQSGNISYGVGKAETAVGRYRITTDFINSDTVSVSLCFKRRVEGYDPKKKGRSGEFLEAPMGLENLDLTKYLEGGAERYVVVRCPADSPVPDGYERYFIPVYVGIGLRVTATVNVTKAGASISGLGVLGVEAQAGNLRGDLVVQTLGVNGEGVTAALPIQSELNQTTVTNAVVAVASIKTLLRDTDTIKAPRLVGLYLPFHSDQQLVNAIISALSAGRVEWPRPCGNPRTEAVGPSP
jgi:hypothetical protein